MFSSKAKQLTIRSHSSVSESPRCRKKLFAANKEIPVALRAWKISAVPNRGAMDGKLPRSEQTRLKME